MLPNIGKQKLLQSTHNLPTKAHCPPLRSLKQSEEKALDRKLMNEFIGDHKNLMTSHIVKQM